MISELSIFNVNTSVLSRASQQHLHDILSTFPDSSSTLEFWQSLKSDISACVRSKHDVWFRIIFTDGRPAVFLAIFCNPPVKDSSLQQNLNELLQHTVNSDVADNDSTNTSSHTTWQSIYVCAVGRPPNHYAVNFQAL
jgi:23S rRNA A1618 N6-methylase RlmF